MGTKGLKMEKSIRKILVFLLSLVILFLFLYDWPNKSIEQESANMSPTQSFGNQINQDKIRYESINMDGWIYSIDKLSAVEEGIVKFHIDDINKKEVIYSNNTGWLSKLSGFGGWIYFIETTGVHSADKVRLIRINSDGTERIGPVTENRQKRSVEW